MTLLLGVASGAGAQVTSGAAEDATLQEVVVTGSRIKGNPDVASANPITVIGAAELQNSNSVDIESVLAKLPSVGTDGLNGAESSNFGGNGFEFVDLRNLGPQRTLVLVDGQRFVTSANAGAFAGVDFNNIPTEFVDHIEVLRDGASPVYGSDAVAGVINIITKQHFTGVEVNGSVGSTDRWDKKTYAASITMGQEFERGSIVFNLGYNKEEPIYQHDRAFARNINNSGTSAFYLDGHYQGTNPDGTAYNLIGNGHGGFSPAPAVYDTTQIPNLFSGVVRKTFNTSGDYQLNPGSELFPVEVVAQVMYTDRSSFGLANPDPQVGTVNSVAGVGTAGNIEGLPGPLTPDPGLTTSSLRFRSSVIGPREFNTDVQTYRTVAGLRGTLWKKFDWELKVIHGQSSGEAHTNNLVDEPNLLTFTGDLNNLTAADLTLLRDNTTDTLKTTEDEYETQISGPAVRLPAGDLTFAVGGDIRREALADTPDFANATGRTDQGGTPTRGQYNLKEGFLELNVPILKDVFLAKQLSFDGAARFSHYSNFGDAKTWKVTLNWAPVDDIRLRSTLSTTFRAPTIQELFLANTTAFNGVNDPCDTAPTSNSLLTSSSGAKRATVQANCIAALSAVGINPATFQPSVGGSQQIAGISGGNPNLTPEKARDFAIGAVLTPTFVRNLQVTVDYWRIKLANQIIQIPDAQTALNLCYASVGLSDASCATIGPRTPIPISNQPTAGGISSQSLTSLNSGTISTDGIDFGLDYTLALSDAGLPVPGKVSLSDVATNTRSFLAADQSGAINDFLGKIQQTSSPFTSANPKWQNRVTASWFNDSFSFAWSARVIGHVRRYTDPNAPSANCAVAGDCLPSVWYSDIVGSYKYRNYTFIAGVDNLFDKQPPFFFDTVGRTNSNPFVYDYVGRFMFVKAVAKF